MLSPEIGFLGSLLITVALLLAAAVAGRRRKIGTHVAFVFSAVAMLAVAIVFALRVGELYDLEAAGAITPIHLNLARFTTLFYLWPLVTGPLAAKNKIPRKIHRAGAWLALLLTLAATVTGVMMLMGAEKYPVAAETNPVRAETNTAPGESVPQGSPELGIEEER